MASFLELAQKHGTDKVGHHGYHFFYPRFLEPLRDQTFTMLEIGYFQGESARMWEEYFPHAAIFAMDLESSRICDGHEVIQGDQGRPEDLARIADRLVSARLIIDDGSHQPGHQFETFNFLFRRLLEPGGIYIIEDIECNYWHPESQVYGYRIGFFNAIEATTKLIDQINAEFSGRRNEMGISTVTYGQNCIIITKQTAEERKFFDRPYRFAHFVERPVQGYVHTPTDG